MPPSMSPEPPVKRPRTTHPGDAEPQVGAATTTTTTTTTTTSGGCSGGGGGHGGKVAVGDLATSSVSEPRQPLPQREQPQPRPQPQPQQQQQGAPKSLQEQIQQPQLQPQSQPPLQPVSQPQSQPPSQPVSQPQSQPPSQPSAPAHSIQQQLQRSPQLSGGAVSVLLPAALPRWADEALRGVDPFWRPRETLAVIITQPSAPAPGTHGQLQSASALFAVGPSALAAIAERKAQARLVCIQPDDGPPRRCHWYGGSYILLNQRPYEVTNEDRVQLFLGPSQADQAVDLSGGLLRGANRLTLLWPVGVAGAVAALRLCEPRPPDELYCAVAPPLPLATAVELVRAHVAGEGTTRGGDGGDSGSGVKGTTALAEAAEAAGPQEGGCADGDAAPDGPLGFGPVTVSLRCPLHGGLAAVPAHFGATAAASPLAFFDLAAFLELARRSGSWACPASGRLGDLGDLRPHAFLSAVLRTLEHNGVRGRVEAIEVSPCGGWRPKDSRLPILSALDADPTDPAGRPPPSFDPRLLDPEDDGRDVVDLTDD